MKSRMLFMGGAALFSAALASSSLSAYEDRSETRSYTIKDLGTLGGSTSMAFSVNNSGVVSGTAGFASGITHATLWYRNTVFDIGTPGLGGHSGSASLNSTAFTVNDFAQ